jgi:hypothetical protein
VLKSELPRASSTPPLLRWGTRARPTSLSLSVSLWRACFGRNMNVALPALEAPGSVCTRAAPLAASVSVRHAGRGQGPMQLAQRADA